LLLAATLLEETKKYAKTMKNDPIQPTISNSISIYVSYYFPVYALQKRPAPQADLVTGHQTNEYGHLKTYICAHTSIVEKYPTM
jgi:hypothetical protein